MSDHGRRGMTQEDRAEQQRIEQSLKVSSYLDDVYEAIHHGAAPKVNVPNYKEPTPGEMHSSLASESQGFNMNFDGLYASAAGQMSPDQMKTAMGDSHTPRDGNETTFSSTTPAPSSRPTFTISRNQAMALKKYPTLIEFLGRSEGEKIANRISGDMNLLMAEIISSNSKEANAGAVGGCQADKQNLRQYFQGDGWLCRVTASGPFRGDEAIYYHREKDVACVLRRTEVDGGEVRYSDISENFNIIYEAEAGAMLSPPVEEKTAEASVGETTSAAEGESDEHTEKDQPVEVVEELAKES